MSDGHELCHHLARDASRVGADGRAGQWCDHEREGHGRRFATGRFTSPEEVATLVVLLASERTANVTGANYVIDGGLIKTT